LRNGAAPRGAHWKGADDGDAWTKSSTEEGLWWREASEADAWAVGEECATLGRGRARRTTRGGEKSIGGRWLRQRERHAAWGAWGLALTDGRHPDRVPAARAAVGAPLFRQWHIDASDTRAPASDGRGSEARARVGRPGETRSGPSSG
jgi:hypothetical protein